MRVFKMNKVFCLAVSILFLLTTIAIGEEVIGLQVDQSGNVGIGVTAPSQKLDVNGGIKIGDTNTSEQGAMRYSSGDFQGYTASGWQSLTEGAGDGDKVKADSGDVTGGYLDAKVDGVGVEVDTSSHQLELADAWMVYSYQTPSGIHGGTATSGAWYAYPVNTEDYDPNNWAYVNSNYLVLTTPGTYIIEATATFFRTNVTMIRIRNTTDGITYGQSAAAYATAPKSGTSVNQNPTVFTKPFTITAQKSLQLQYRCS